MLYNPFSVLLGDGADPAAADDRDLFGAMLRIDRTLITAAKIHGASEWQAFRTVFFPLSLPGVYGAGPAGVRAGARLLRDAGAARQPARDHDRANHHGGGEPDSGLAAGQRRRGRPAASSPRRSPRSTTVTSASTGCGEAPTNEHDGGQARTGRGGLAVLLYLIFPVIVVRGDLVQLRQFPGVSAARLVAALVSKASSAIRNGSTRCG